MYNLSHAEAQLLFEQNTYREELTPSERIPKYRSVLEELFQLLTRDAPTHLYTRIGRVLQTLILVLRSIHRDLGNWYGAQFDLHTTVGIITTFRARIRQYLPADLRNVLMVDTVERYQGSERDIILQSFVVNHPSQLQSIESINSDGAGCKLNVALTRAKEYLMLLGTDEVLQSGKSSRPLLRHVRDAGGYLSAREAEVKDVGEGVVLRIRTNR